MIRSHSFPLIKKVSAYLIFMSMLSAATLSSALAEDLGDAGVVAPPAATETVPPAPVLAPEAPVAAPALPAPAAPAVAPAKVNLNPFDSNILAYSRDEKQNKIQYITRDGRLIETDLNGKVTKIEKLDSFFESDYRAALEAKPKPMKGIDPTDPEIAGFAANSKANLKVYRFTDGRIFLTDNNDQVLFMTYDESAAQRVANVYLARAGANGEDSEENSSAPEAKGKSATALNLRFKAGASEAGFQAGVGIVFQTKGAKKLLPTTAIVDLYMGKPVLRIKGSVDVIPLVAKVAAVSVNEAGATLFALSFHLLKADGTLSVNSLSPKTKEDGSKEAWQGISHVTISPEIAANFLQLSPNAGLVAVLSVRTGITGGIVKTDLDPKATALVGPHGGLGITVAVMVHPQHLISVDLGGKYVYGLMDDISGHYKLNGSAAYTYRTLSGTALSFGAVADTDRFIIPAKDGSSDKSNVGNYFVGGMFGVSLD